jgi:serine/threonine protein kinase
LVTGLGGGLARRYPIYEILESAVTTTLGRYKLGSVIGRGPNGEVRRAIDQQTRATVAVKIVRAGAVGEARWAERLGLGWPS